MIFTQGRSQPSIAAEWQGVVAKRRQISIICCMLIALCISVTIPVGGAEAHTVQAHTSSTKPTKTTPSQLRQALKQQIHITHAKKALTPATKSTVKPADTPALPAYNNVGTSDDSNPIAGSLDGSNSYSAQALQGVGLVPGQNVTYNNVNFVWPNAAAGTPNNYVPNGQLIPVTPVLAGAVKLGFLGASTNGTTSGTATITYTDTSTSTFTLTLSDWASTTIDPSNSVVAPMTYINAATYQRTLTVNVFYTDVAIAAGKTVQSVTLPAASTAGHMHIFAVGVSGPAFNNTGISLDGSPSGANLDGGGYSYSASALAAVNITGGSVIPVDGISYPWTTVATASPDDYQAAGQTLPVVPVANATVLGFLGAASGGASSGTVTIAFTDGSTQTSTLGLSDWTLSSGTQTTPSFSNLIAATMTYRNTSTTQQTMTNYLFAAEVTLPATKTVQSVTLPTTTAPGVLHIFAIGTRSLFNNIAISDDHNPSAARFDGNGIGGYSFSIQEFQNQLIFPGQNMVVNGIVYTWPNVPVGAADNYVASGQTIAVTPIAQATTLGFLGAATGGSTSGTATVTYTDGSTQTITLGLTNWWANTPAYTTNTIATTLSYINEPNARSTGSYYLYDAEFSLQAGKTLQSVTLPAASATAQLHIFAISTRSAYNNAAISDDANLLGANFDGSGNSYSSEDFTDPNTGMGWNPGDTLTYNGMNFLWPNVPADQGDNYQAAGQTIPVAPVSNANTLGFVGAASNGNSSGTATITYTDGTTQTFTLAMSDWILNNGSGTPATGNRLFAVLNHHNTLQGQRNLTTYLFYSDVALQTGKVVQSVTLPGASAVTPGQLHIFSIGTRAGTGYFNNVGTSDDLTTTFANMDGQGDSYSLEALQASSTHIAQGQSFVFNGVTFPWPTSYSVIPDNYESAGATISFAPTIPITPIAGATTLALVGTATSGTASGTATITYTDNSTSTFTLGFMDWTAGTPTNGDHLVTTMTYYNNAAGQQTRSIYLYEAETTLTTGKTVQSVTLPTTTDHLHVFAVGTK